LAEKRHQAADSVVVSGTTDDITIHRDEWGIPAVFASNNYDLFFGHGYAIAEDRLFQMEVSRRETWGRMAEVFGEKFLESDKNARILGARRRALRKAKLLSPYFRGIFQGYADGVSAYIENHDVAQRQGFKEFAFVPELWTLEDVITVSESTHFMDLGGRAWDLYKKVGLELAREIFPLWPDDTPVVVPESEMAKNKELYTRLKATPSDQRRGPAPVHERSTTGSNNCVVTGSKSASGKPILLADPQMYPSRIPQRFHEIVLHGGDFHVRGITFPGRPGIIVGFNRNCAWAVTGLGGNRSDLFEEKLHPDNPDLYLYRTRWEPVEKRTEIIKVKGDDDVALEIRSTHHGPICGEYFGETEGAFALQHVMSQTDDTASLPYLRLNTVTNYDEFAHAISKFESTTAHLIFADRDGNIAYSPAGKFPRRPAGHYWGPVPGWDAEFEWDGFVPFEEKPYLHNPDQEFIVTANNLITTKWYPYSLIDRPGTGTRFLRIREMLMEREKITLDQMEQVVRADISLCDDLRTVAPYVAGLVTRSDDASPEEKEAASRMAGWDYQFDAKTVGGTIYDRFIRALQEVVFRPRLADDFRLGLEGWDIIRLRPDSPWFDDPSTPEVETRDDVYLKTFKRIVAELTEQLGPHQNTWTWDRVSFSPISHQLAELDPHFKGTLPDFGEIVMEGSKALSPQVLSTVSYSQIVDVTDMDKSRGVMSIGNSELYDSPHLSDQIDLWKSFTFRPAPLSERKVLDASRTKLMLKKTS